MGRRKKNLLKRAEELVARRALVKHIGSPNSYLSVVVRKKDEDISPAYRVRISEALEKIIEEVDKIIEEENERE